MGGTTGVRAYDILGGRILWESSLTASLGRGVVTENAVYVPDENRIVVLDPQTGERLATTSLTQADGTPVGNLFVTGNRLVVLGAGVVSHWNVSPAPAAAKDQP